MMHVFLVDNSLHLKEGLDSEFLVAAENEEQAKLECLRLLAEDKEMHLETVRSEIESMKRSVEKYDGAEPSDDPAEQFMRRAVERNKETIARLSYLVDNFTDYKAECLTVKRISPRLKHGQVQYEI